MDPKPLASIILPISLPSKPSSVRSNISFQSQTSCTSSPSTAFATPFFPLSLTTSTFHTPLCRRRCLSVSMADVSKPKPNIGKGGVQFDTGKGGGVATITRPDTKKKTKRRSKTEREPSWRVLLHNDDVHTFEYVTGAIVKVVRTVSRKKAHRITMQAHTSGVATVTTTWKAMAEEYCKGLQMQGLTSSIAPDSSFTH